MSTPMIKLDHMSHTYEDENGQTVYALKDISLEIQPGEFVAVIGTNGSGKSTLAKHFNVLLVPTEGTCEVLGMRTDDPAKSARTWAWFFRILTIRSSRPS